MKKFVLVLLSVICILLVPQEVALATETLTSDKFVIVIDPGHDDTHSGAQNGDLGEEDLVYKIAQYCKEELDKYNVTVYMTRCGYECENGGRAITSTECNAKRVEFAASVGADIYVSFHLNSSTSASAHGTGIFYPNSNYRPDLGEEGHGLANIIFDKLTSLGIEKWSGGVMIRNSQDNTLYPDGSLADYYGIIRRNKEAGIPAVLIEHAFISNASDVEKFLCSDEKLKKLGVTDASAIIEYYGLSDDVEVDGPEKATVRIENINTVSGVFDVIVSDIEVDGKIQRVEVPVWSDVNQADIVWYIADKQADGTYKAHVDVANHNCSFTEYQVHTYVRTKSDRMINVGMDKVDLSSPETVVNVNLSNDGSKLEIDAWYVPGTFGNSLENVTFAVWSEENGQDDLAWYTASASSDRFIADVLLDNHKSSGMYFIHTYADYVNGEKRCLDMMSIDIGTGLAVEDIQITNVNTVSGCFDIVISGLQVVGGIEYVTVPVWSVPDQSDIVWYMAEKQVDGTYRAHVDVANHNCNFANYQVHTYVKNQYGQMYNIGMQEVNLTSPSSVVTVSMNDNYDTIHMNAWHVPGTFGESLKSVTFAVWSEANGQDDLRWYTGEAVADQYVADAILADHSDFGNYFVHTYAHYSNGIMMCVDMQVIEIKEVSVDKIELANVNNIAGTFDVIVSNVTAVGGVQQVQVPVWSKPDQSDIVWYDAEKQVDGTYRAHVDVANHNCNFANYQVHTYVKNGYGQLYNVGMHEVDLTPPGVEISATMNENYSELILDARHVPGTSGNSLKSVSFAVWSEINGQDDLQWYTGELSEDKFVVNVPMENHSDVGNYYVHVYANRPIGNEFLGAITFDRPLTPIMGYSNITKEQLMNYYSEHATYPTYYECTDATTLDAFCQIYIEECNVEGVKVEVAFCQAMIETGFLSFGGDVDITQHNFAGIGATGNGNPGCSFATVREGVRAQVQHLKAYASSESLSQECVDPRFCYVTRETAPYVEWLGIQENPYGAGWAASGDYGYTIRDNYILDLYN